MCIAVAGATGLIGRQLTELATNERHEVVKIARSTGFDLLDSSGLDRALESVDVVVDVTQSPSLDEQQATDFFQTVATNLGNAARAAGVSRTVVLSIVGADKSPDYGHYVAKGRAGERPSTGLPGTRRLARNPVP